MLAYKSYQIERKKNEEQYSKTKFSNCNGFND